MIVKASGTLVGPVLRVAVAVTAGSLALGIFLAVPAAAADKNETLLELSRDGVNYAPGSTKGPFFAQARGYVPGESRSERVWVRNASRDSAYFSLAVLNTSQAAGSTLPDYLTLQAATSKGTSLLAAFPGVDGCKTVVETWQMNPGEALRLNLDFGLSLAAPNSTRNQEPSFDLVFLLQGINGGNAVSPCTAGGVVNPLSVSNGLALVTPGEETGDPRSGRRQVMSTSVGMGPGSPPLTVGSGTANDAEGNTLLPLTPRYGWPFEELLHPQ